ncbi:tRNA-uridine aminocarboxypropyltransferase [Photobacterium ganghwense]|uniref:tRNA-uridine aminocarboxypropyltransferase n=1 Tax=Photobacterium ganghwense TaxID=320778 RepID=UPI001C2D6CA2|nr:DTW domain-containing protein [Photobacterium ganghwense]MBV1839217.1 DTW domain-containing protein [Photobacterium ganghwense]
MTHPTACPRCGLRFNCICHTEPTLGCTVPFLLLTHPNELGKTTNTGQLMTRTLPDCQRLIWDRVNPPQALLEQIADPRYQPWLLFPGDDTTPASPFQAQPGKTPLIIILDATWQEARKMVRRSPWLAALPRLALVPQADSAYALRRNQQPGNLCTCEAGIAVLQELGFAPDADRLQEYFATFIDIFHAEQSGHQKKPPAHNKS